MPYEITDDVAAEFPALQVNGLPLKSLAQILLERRATPHFRPDPVPDEYLDAILRLATQAPSGYNLQPWRFVVVRNAVHRERLKRAAMNQAKVGEAPVVIIAFAIKGDWKRHMDAIFAEGIERGCGDPEKVESQKAAAAKFLDNFPASVWVNRHTMIAFTVMMLVAEMFGLDTAPMEGFDADAVKREFGLPAESEVIALLAIGFGQAPDKPYGGRLPLREIISQEHFGWPWPAK
jgi:nitroreductase